MRGNLLEFMSLLVLMNRVRNILQKIPSRLPSPRRRWIPEPVDEKLAVPRTQSSPDVTMVHNGLNKPLLFDTEGSCSCVFSIFIGTEGIYLCAFSLLSFDTEIDRSVSLSFPFSAIVRICLS
jgi:hypothetical protein